MRLSWWMGKKVDLGGGRDSGAQNGTTGAFAEPCLCFFGVCADSAPISVPWTLLRLLTGAGECVSAFSTATHSFSCALVINVCRL